jgi:hypothetical protein
MMLRAMVDGAADARNSLIDRYGLQEFKQL